jgi:hypothetical protein
LFFGFKEVFVHCSCTNINFQKIIEFSLPNCFFFLPIVIQKVLSNLLLSQKRAMNSKVFFIYILTDSCIPDSSRVFRQTKTSIQNLHWKHRVKVRSCFYIQVQNWILLQNDSVIITYN